MLIPGSNYFVLVYFKTFWWNYLHTLEINTYQNSVINEKKGNWRLLSCQHTEIIGFEYKLSNTNISN